MKNLKRFNENWFSKKHKKDDSIANKIIEYIEDTKKRAQTLMLDITPDSKRIDKHGVDYFTCGYRFKVNESNVKIVGRYGKNWIIEDDRLQIWEFEEEHGLFMNNKKLNVSNKLIIKIFNLINDIYEKNRKREFEDKIRFNESWFSKFNKPDDDIAKEIIDHIEDAKSKAQTLILDVERKINNNDSIEYNFKINELKIKIKLFKFAKYLPDLYEISLNNEELSVSKYVIKKIYILISDIYERNRKRKLIDQIKN